MLLGNHRILHVCIQDSSGRIIFLNCYPKYAREILCQVCAHCLLVLFRINHWTLVLHVLQASTLGMVAPRYAWIIYGWNNEGFWKQSPSNGSGYHVFDKCSTEQVMNIINQIIVIHNDPRYDEQDQGNPIIGNLVRIGIQ